MNISDSDKPKLIVLVCLTILVIAFGVYRAMNVAKPSVAVAPPSTESATGKNGAVTASPHSAIVVSAAPTYSVRERDPFMPLIFKKKDIGNTRPIAKPGANVLPGGQKIVLPPWRIGRLGGAKVTVVPVPETPPNLTLVGVIVGARNMAVIRGDGDTRYMLYEGQRIDGKYIVKSISRAGVWIKSKDRMIVLRLGGNDAVQNRAR